MKSYPARLKQVNEKVGIGKISSTRNTQTSVVVSILPLRDSTVIAIVSFTPEKINSNHRKKGKSNIRKRYFVLVPLPHFGISLTFALEKKENKKRGFPLQEKGEAANDYPVPCSVGVLLFFICFLAVLPVCVCAQFPPPPNRGYKLKARPPEDHSHREPHSPVLIHTQHQYTLYLAYLHPLFV